MIQPAMAQQDLTRTTVASTKEGNQATVAGAVLREFWASSSPTTSTPA